MSLLNTLGMCLRFFCNSLPIVSVLPPFFCSSFVSCYLVIYLLCVSFLCGLMFPLPASSRILPALQHAHSVVLFSLYVGPTCLYVFPVPSIRLLKLAL